MMRRFIFTSFAVLAATASFAGDQPSRPGELLVKFVPGTYLQEQAAHVAMGAKVLDTIPNIGVSHIRVPAKTKLSAALNYYRKLGIVEYVEPNYIGEYTFTPNDPLFASQWGMSKIQCQTGWDLSLGVPEIIVAVADSGVLPTHPDLAAKLTGGRNMVDGTANVMDNNGHGTHVHGIVGAITNNAVGVVGVGANCKMMPLKLGDAAPDGAATAAAIVWAADHGAKVVQMSLTVPQTTALEDAVNYAWGKGLIVIDAAGNSSTNVKSYPAAYDNCIAIGSTDKNDNKSDFSNFGDWVDVAAPGSDILSTWNDGAYNTISGTSMAAPHVSGMTGLLFSLAGASTSNVLIRQIIESTTDPVVGNPFVHGRINVFKALSAVPSPDIPLSFIPTSAGFTQGTNATGGVNEVKNADNLYYSIRTVRTPGLGHRAIVDTTFSIAGQNTPSSLSASIMARAEVKGQGSNDALGVQVQFKNSSGTWVTLGNYTLKKADTVYTVNLPNKGKGYYPGGKVTMRCILTLPDRLASPDAYVLYRINQYSLNGMFPK